MDDVGREYKGREDRIGRKFGGKFFSKKLVELDLIGEGGYLRETEVIR